MADRYREHHRAVWPGVLEVLREIGIMKMRIYLHGHRLFMYMEAADDFNDPVQDFARYADDPRGREWDKLMCGFQERVPGAASLPASGGPLWRRCSTSAGSEGYSHRDESGPTPLSRRFRSRTSRRNLPPSGFTLSKSPKTSLDDAAVRPETTTVASVSSAWDTSVLNTAKGPPVSGVGDYGGER